MLQSDQQPAEGAIIGQHIPWAAVKNRQLQVDHFTALAHVEGSKVLIDSKTIPYGLLSLKELDLTSLNWKSSLDFDVVLNLFSEDEDLMNLKTIMPVTHKIDFRNLWEAFNERGVEEDEAIVVTYHPKNFLSKVFPSLIIEIYPKAIYEMGPDTELSELPNDWNIPLNSWYGKDKDKIRFL